MTMNPLLRSLRESSGGGTYEPPPGPTGGVVGFENMMNMGPLFYWDPMPVFVDLLRQGPGMYNSANSAHVAIDSQGWPNEDVRFGMQRLPPDSPLQQTVTVLIDGNPGSVSMVLANYWTLGAVNYNSGTDTATITLTSPNTYDMNLEGCQLLCSGTKKTPTSAVGSGLRRIRIPRPGYEARPNVLITDEYKSIMQFTTLRCMKSMGTEGNWTVSAWSDYPHRYSQWGRSWGGEIAAMTTMPIEDIIEMANTMHVNLWLCLHGTSDGTLGPLSEDYGLAQWVEANLDPDLHCYYEHANETWNFGYGWFAWGTSYAMKELHGFWHDSYDRAYFRASAMRRVSNVVTVTTNYNHGMTADQASYQIVFQGRSGVAPVVAHPINSTQFTIPDTGPNCKIAVTLGGQDSDGTKDFGGTRVAGIVNAYCNLDHGFTTGDLVYVPLDSLTSSTKLFTITVTGARTFTFPDAGTEGEWLRLTAGNNSWGGSLSTGSPLTWDGDASPSQYMSEKYWTRRRVQMSDLIKSAVPSGKFMTRHRPVYMSQWAQGTLYLFADWAKSMIERGLGTTWKDKFYAMGGGSYPDGTMNDGSRPVQDTNNPYTKAQYLVEYQESTTTGFGVTFFTPDIFSSYAMSEGIKSIAYEVGVDTRMYSNGPYKSANAYELRQAVSDPQWKVIESNYPRDLAQNGAHGAAFFNGEMNSKTLAMGQGYWGIAWGILTASPKQQFHNEWQASPPLMTKNVAPGTVDARVVLGVYFTPSSAYLTMQSPTSHYPLSGDRWRYIINANEARTMSVSLTYKTLAAGTHTVAVVKNGVLRGYLNVTSAGVGNIATTNAVNVPMDYGPNGIDLVRDSSNSHFELRSLNFS